MIGAGQQATPTTAVTLPAGFNEEDSLSICTPGGFVPAGHHIMGVNQCGLEFLNSDLGVHRRLREHVDGDLELDDRRMEMNWAQFWHNYERRTGALTWRIATPADLPAIRRLRSVVERFLGKPQRSLSLFEKPVLLALVAENANGKIVDAVCVEMAVEIIKVSCTEKGAEEVAALEDDLYHWLRDLGFQTVWAATMPRMKSRMAVLFERVGFKCLDGVMSCWRRRL